MRGPSAPSTLVELLFFQLLELLFSLKASMQYARNGRKHILSSNIRNMCTT